VPVLVITNDALNGTNITTGAGARRVSQSFTATATGGLANVQIRYYEGGHSAGASLRLNLSVAVGDDPGAIIGTTDTFVIPNIGGNDRANFNFLVTPIVTLGTKYCLETEWVVPSVGGDIEPVGSTTDVYAGGKARWTIDSGATYSDYAAPDLGMEIDYLPITVGPMAIQIISIPTILQSITKVSYQVIWYSGATPIGTISVEANNTGSVLPEGGYTGGKWAKMPFNVGGVLYTDIPISGNSGDGLIDIESTSVGALRLVYNPTSGDGILTATVVGKVA
jgi:hypothetical protein